ncbi:MAG: Ig-like domain-containing protein, partial [Bifidobacteriaceae bacterium]|nr:Ig-like domain-containing protein [Bifidobacteriaceae bacterium]
ASAALADLIARAEAARQAEYTPAAWVALAAALASAKAAASDPGATAGSLGQAIAWLSIAMAARSAATPPPGTSANQTVITVKAGQSKVRLVKGKGITVPAFGYLAVGGRAKVTWKSSKTAVATVSATGRITARKAGKATITASAGGKKATIAVTVVAKRPAASKAKAKSITATVPRSIRVGAAVSVRPTYKPATATSIKVTYTSSRPTVATIDKAGRLIAKAPGRTAIRVKAGAKSKKYTVTVTAAP